MHFLTSYYQSLYIFNHYNLSHIIYTKKRPKGIQKMKEMLNLWSRSIKKKRQKNKNKKPIPNFVFPFSIVFLLSRHQST